jgi:TolA-binding protein
MSRSHVFIAGLLVAGSLAGYFLMSATGEEPIIVHGQSRPQQHSASLPPVQHNDATALTTLQRQLEREKQVREDLQSRLESLQMRVEQLEQAGDGQNVIATAPAGQNRQSGTLPAVRSSVQALIDAGIGADQAAWIQERLDDIELQQLYLRDRATREGWLKEPRYHKERRELQNAVAELRDEVGDDAYDRMLYTLGRANRVVVRDVIQHSPAAQYGLQGGDQIIEYDGQRIFTSQELSSLVTQGSPGVMTLVRVRRENDIHDVYLPRGPLGIRMTAARVMP